MLTLQETIFERFEGLLLVLLGLLEWLTVFSLLLLADSPKRTSSQLNIAKFEKAPKNSI